MKPTDQQLNEAVAKVLGWLPPDERSVYWRRIGQTGNFSCIAIPMGYTSDRNLLKEMTDHLAKVYLRCAYIKFLTEFKPGSGFSQIDVYLAITAPPRAHCIAFLRATGNWHEDWSE